ncbi:MAG: hypothetical protein K1W35_11780 [Lachnospiraceae bacterium]
MKCVVSLFMRMDVERKQAAKAARVRRTGRREGHSPTRLHSPMQRKNAAKAAHGARGEQGKMNLRYSIAQMWKGNCRGFV